MKKYFIYCLNKIVKYLLSSKYRNLKTTSNSIQNLLKFIPSLNNHKIELFLHLNLLFIKFIAKFGPIYSLY